MNNKGSRPGGDLVDRRHFIFARIIQAVPGRRLSYAEAGKWNSQTDLGYSAEASVERANVGMFVMETLRRFTAKLPHAFLLVVYAFSRSVWGQPGSSCQGPAEIEPAIGSHPSAAAYDALGP